MNYKKLILFIIPVLCISCANSSDNKKANNKDSAIVHGKEFGSTIIDSNVYDDIDIFKLEGIGNIKHPTNYPYIKIENEGNAKKRIVYKYSATDSSESIYKKEKRYCLKIDEYWADSGYNRIYEYIQPDKITRLVYYGSHLKTGFHLDDIIVIEKNKSTMYSYWGKKGPYIEPDINNLDLIKDKVSVVVIEKFKRQNGILTAYSQSIDRIKNKIFESDTACYNIGEHSWFWFETFGWKNKVACN